jgi:hypothetical protein
VLDNGETFAPSRSFEKLPFAALGRTHLPPAINYDKNTYPLRCSGNARAKRTGAQTFRGTAPALAF